MSLAGLQWATSRKDELAPVDRAQIDEYLAGNLCRCTGYGPIVNAAREACSAPLPESWRTQATVADTTLRAWQEPAQPLCCRSNGNMFAAPRSRTDLQAIVSDHPGATLLAGATDIGLWVTKQGRRLSSVIYLGQVPELQRLIENDGTLEIGAGVSLQDASATLSEISPDLNRLLRRFGSRQVRNQGTVGGNIANGSPIGDLPPALIALGAQLRIASTRGVREIPLDAFFIDYGQQDLAPASTHIAAAPHHSLPSPPRQSSRPPPPRAARPSPARPYACGQARSSPCLQALSGKWCQTHETWAFKSKQAEPSRQLWQCNDKASA